MPGTLPGSTEVIALLGAIIADLIADAQAAGQRAAQAYQDGLAEGLWQGARIGAAQAETEMAEHWEQASRMICAKGGTYKERRAAERERARPKPGDHMGRLCPEEYLGTPVGQ